MPKRAWFRHESGPPSPRTPGSTLVSGTRTSVREISPVVEAQSDLFPRIVGVSKPAMVRPFGLLANRNRRRPKKLLDLHRGGGE
jgi:hypothetical protein